jgi:8-oxo-dGTP pyrophosphatase MutT (NUDIX family)
VDPGKFDSLVGGGICGDETPLQTLLRECQEEAGIARPMARRAIPVGVMDSTALTLDGTAAVLHRERLTLYDLKVPPDFTPIPVDGETAQVQCLPPDEVMASLAAGHWTNEGAWATRDLIARYAVASPAAR